MVLNHLRQGKPCPADPVQQAPSQYTFACQPPQLLCPLTRPAHDARAALLDVLLKEGQKYHCEVGRLGITNVTVKRGDLAGASAVSGHGDGRSSEPPRDEPGAGWPIIQFTQLPSPLSFRPLGHRRPTEPVG